MSQEELAERAKLSVESIGALERGRRRAPYRETIRMISDALGLSDAARLELEAAAKRGRPGVANAEKYDSAEGPGGTDRVKPGSDESRHTLLRPLSSFHGRRKELVDLGRLLADHRLVSIVGAGGIGKTRLAIEIAFDLAARYPDGTWFVDLAPLDDNSLVTRSVISTLGLRQVDGQNDLDTLVRHLGHRDALIVIDNCEHVIDQVADLAGALARACPNLRILATTREPLNISGERVYRIPTLASPPVSNQVKAAEGLEFAAVTLFVDRSQAVNAAFSFSDAVAAPVAGICRRLDGVALAIELAASRTAVLSPHQILEQLEDHFGILTGGSRTALPRQRTMRETIRWSYDRLSEPEQALFRRSAVFVSGFPLESLLFIVKGGAEGALLDTLTSLVNKSLIVADDSATRTRYRLLEPIRAFALEMLDRTSERSEMQMAFARWSLAFVQSAHAQWETTSPKVWSERAEPEMDNVRAALQWALADRHDIELAQLIVARARRLWARLGPSEGKRCVLAAQQAVVEQTPDAIRAELALAEANIFIALEQYQAVLAATQTYERYGNESDALMLAEAREFAGYALVQLGQNAQGEQLLTASIETYRARGAQQLHAHAVNALAAALLIRSELDQARRLFREAMQLFGNVGNERGVGSVAANLAETEYSAGNVEEAMRLAADALAAFKGGREARLCRLNMAAYLVRLQRYDEARQLARESLVEGGRARSDDNVARALQHLAAVAALRLPDAPPRWTDLESAARLIGFVDAALAAAQLKREFTEQHEYDAVVDALRSHLNAERLAQLYADGRSWTEDKAVAQALLM